MHRAKVYCMVLGVVDTIEDMCIRLGCMLEADDLTGLAACSANYLGWMQIVLYANFLFGHTIVKFHRQGAADVMSR